ncbi:MAG: hypothetical protein JW939_02145, partial [Candidatus Thermoplasmatota archaeon]|nr:hypothetical protein [Candidatus Thermoplasmatota archaeon]
DTLYGTPANDHVGTYRVNVSVHDGNGGRDHLNFTLEVENVNDHPIITSSPVTTATEDIPYSMLLEGHDIDPTDDNLTFGFVSNADWLHLNGTNLSGTPANDDVGSWWVNVTLFDGNGGIDEMTFPIIVENVNDPPFITTENVITVLQDQTYSVDYNATDIDPTEDVLIWALETDADWLSLEGSTLIGTPTNDDVGTYFVEIFVNDGHGGSDSTRFMLEVINVNDAPYWFKVPEDVRTEEGSQLILECLALDIDEDEIVTYSISSDPASGITVMNLSGTILLSDPEEGTYTINLSATDGKDTIYHEFTIEVTPSDDEEEHPIVGSGLLASLFLIIVPILIVLLILLLIVVLLLLRSARKRSGPWEDVEE